MQSPRAELNVMISGGFSLAYREVLPAFEKTTGISVTTASAASQGTGPNTMKAQLARGARADVVILSREGLSELMVAGRIVGGTDVDLASVQGTGERGRINAEIFKRHLPPPFADHEYFICGPNVMMDAIEKALGDLGVPMSKYHSERYSFV